MERLKHALPPKIKATFSQNVVEKIAKITIPKISNAKK